MSVGGSVIGQRVGRIVRGLRVERSAIRLRVGHSVIWYGRAKCNKVKGQA